MLHGVKVIVEASTLSVQLGALLDLLRAHVCELVTQLLTPVWARAEGAPRRGRDLRLVLEVGELCDGVEAIGHLVDGADGRRGLRRVGQRPCHD